MSAFVILPIHLFTHDIISEQLEKITPPISKIYILEEPIYFGDHKTHLNFNQLKLIYHRATLQYYLDYLSSHIKIPITYLDYKTLKSPTTRNGYPTIKKHSHIYMFDPVDTYLETKYTHIFKSKLAPFLETPLFLTTHDQLEEYNKQKTGSRFYHASFYTWQRTRLDILADSKTYDTENRNMMPRDTTIPPLPKHHTTTTDKYITAAIEYVKTHWPDNLKPIYVQNKERQITPASILFPITHESALEWLNNFCQKKFLNFGKYEDAIDAEPRNFLFHSVITPMLNIGLITPKQVVDTITTYYKSHKTRIGIANYEGFIRQIIGWREYQRYIYKYAGEKMRGMNHFGNTRRLSEVWYSGNTGIKPVDDAIKLAINDGYIHHILRLMVVGNMMNLVGIHPDDVYKWFMEFSLDSYDWVMVGNVYSMALWADGGLTMRKPYISGSGYIIKMGNFTKAELKEKDETDLTWPEKWDILFHSFIDRNDVQLEKTYYAGLVKSWKAKSITERAKEMKLAKQLISRLS